MSLQLPPAKVSAWMDQEGGACGMGGSSSGATWSWCSAGFGPGSETRPSKERRSRVPPPLGCRMTDGAAGCGGGWGFMRVDSTAGVGRGAAAALATPPLALGPRLGATSTPAELWPLLGPSPASGSDLPPDPESEVVVSERGPGAGRGSSAARGGGVSRAGAGGGGGRAGGSAEAAGGSCVYLVVSGSWRTPPPPGSSAARAGAGGSTRGASGWRLLPGFSPTLGGTGYTGAGGGTRGSVGWGSAGGVAIADRPPGSSPRSSSTGPGSSTTRTSPTGWSGSGSGSCTGSSTAGASAPPGSAGAAEGWACRLPGRLPGLLPDSLGGRGGGSSAGGLGPGPGERSEEVNGGDGTEAAGGFGGSVAAKAGVFVGGVAEAAPGRGAAWKAESEAGAPASKVAVQFAVRDTVAAQCVVQVTR